MEEAVQKTYNQELLRKQPYVDWLDYVKIVVQDFFSKSMFEGDRTRAFYASTEETFSRRQEILQKGKEDEIESLATLEFPFMSFYQKSSPKIINACTGTQIFGVYDENVERYFRFFEVEYDLSCKVFYNNIKDERIGMNQLLWESSYGEIKHSYDLIYKGVPVKIPIFITIQNASETINKTEDYFKKMNVFGLTYECHIRTIMFMINKDAQGNYNPQAYRAFDPWAQDEYTEGIDFVYAEHVKLDFANLFLGLETTKALKVPEPPKAIEGYENITYVEDPVSKEGIIQYTEEHNIFTNALCDQIVSTQLNDSPNVLEVFKYEPEKRVIDEKTHKETSYFSIKFTEELMSAYILSAVYCYCPGDRAVKLDLNELRKNEFFTIDDIAPNTEYQISLVFYDNENLALKSYLLKYNSYEYKDPLPETNETAAVQPIEDNQLPASPTSKRRINGIVGLSF